MVIKSDEDKKEIVQYLQDEFAIAEKETEPYRKVLQRLRRQREAKPEKETKNEPWEKASNVVPPVALTATNSIFAKLKSSYSKRKPFWDINAEDENLGKHVEALTRYFDILAESKNHLDLRKKNNTILYDLCSLGTQFVQIPWHIDYWSFKRHNIAGVPEQVHQMVHNGPAIFPTRMEDFLSRSYFSDIQKAPWISTRSGLTWHELKQRESQGIYENLDEIEGVYKTNLEEHEEKNLRRHGIDVREAKVYDIFSTHLFWDVDGDGIPEDIILFFEPKTGTILREEFNDLGVRAVVKIPYLPVPYELYGLGVGHIVDGCQQEVTSLHNVRMDGTLLHAFQMIVARKGSTFGSKETFRPLKIFKTDGNPRDEVQVFNFPDISPGTIQAETIAVEYAKRAAGASDPLSGFESPTVGSRHTYGGMLFSAEQSQGLLDAIQENVDEGYSEIGQMIFYQLLRNKDQVDLSILPAEDAKLVNELLQIPIEDVPLKLKFTVKTIEPEKTEEARRQMRMTVANLYNLYGQQAIQLLNAITDPNAPLTQPAREAGIKIFIGATKLMDQFLKDFGEDDTKSYLPYIKDMEMLTSAIEQMKTAQLTGGGNVRENIRGPGAGSEPGPGVSGPPVG